MATVAARSALRSVTTSARSATTRLSAGVRPRFAPSPSRTSSQKPLYARIFRSPLELSGVSGVSMLPYHTATASALLTSMLSVSARRHTWTLEDCKDDSVELNEAEQKSLKESERLEKEIADVQELKKKLSTVTADEYVAKHPELKKKFDDEIRNDYWGY